MCELWLFAKQQEATSKKKKKKKKKKKEALFDQDSCQTQEEQYDGQYFLW